MIKKHKNSFSVVRTNGSKINNLTLDEAYSIEYMPKFQEEMNDLADEMSALPKNSQMFGDEIKEMFIARYGKCCYRHFERMKELQKA